jgi:hypothetical protein
MSKAPERSSKDMEAIASEAKLLSEGRSTGDGDHVSDWLDAEASLQSRGLISRWPIAVPALVEFTSRDFGEGHLSVSFQGLLPLSGGNRKPGTIVSVKANEGGVSATVPPPIYPNMLAHEYRTVVVQAVDIAGVLDRIARFIEAVAPQKIPNLTFFESVNAGGQPAFKMKAEYRSALFSPEDFTAAISEIESFISNITLAREVTFNVESISLGSSEEFVLKLLTLKRSQAMAAVALFLGVTFAGSFAMESAKLLADHAIPPAIPAIHQGIQGRVIPPRQEELDDFEKTIERSHRFEPVEQI